MNKIKSHLSFKEAEGLGEGQWHLGNHIADVAAREAVHGPHEARANKYIKKQEQYEKLHQTIFDFEPDLGLKLGQTKPKISSAVPTDRNTTIPNDLGQISTCFADDP